MRNLGTLSEDLKERLRNPQRLITEPGTTILNIALRKSCAVASDKIDFHQAKRLTIKIQHNAQPLVVKYFFPKTIYRRMYYNFVRRDPLLNAYRIHLQLHQSTTIQTSKALCWYKENRYQFSTLVLEFLENHIPIIDYLKNQLANGQLSKLQIMHWLALELATTHNQGFFHQDIKPSNLFVNQSSALVWIDLDQAIYQRQLSIEQRVNNLYYTIRYFIFPLDWEYALPFVESYCAYCRAKVPDATKLFEKILTLYRRQTIVETKRQTTRFADGFLDKEDFSIEDTNRNGHLSHAKPTIV